ncbi:Heterokaryon incompatibility protein 6, OR allele [Fusarium oxysporum f. sp. rapae]|uniref:Heterokaryon incompatibility protein 6, OR allele n=1 Tax=Fusarium oxysporum f. sp. rapae TaxID=485398 RepID=A0A8J5TT83_FUSOX|nr:Heterokaryon incompatibility protein 6, OR allele [Fusarium oxysporum f. sp. rapae]
MSSPEEIAGKWLLSLCSREPSAERDQLLTQLERLKFDEFFALHGRSLVFKTYHVEAVRKCLAKELRVDYPLARALLEKDDTGDLFVRERDLLQVAINRAKIDPGLLHEDPKKSNPELLEMVKLLMAHGAVVDCLDDEGYSPLFYTCILGYEELFRFLINSGADISTVQERRAPEQLVKKRKAAKDGETVDPAEDEPKEQVNLLQVTLDALISPQEIVDMTWVGWPPGVNFDKPLWDLDIEATWGGIIMYLLEEGLSCPKDDPGLVMMLHVACRKGVLEFVKKLLAFEAAADVAGPRMVDGGQGEGSTFGTAMHAAAAGRNIDIVLALIEHGESASCRRHCIFDHRSTKGDLTPIEVAIASDRFGNDENLLEFLEAFMEHASDLESSDYQVVLRYCAQNNELDAAKRLLSKGIRLEEVPTWVSTVNMAKLLVSHGIKLDPAALQEKALKRGRLNLLRWCVIEYGAKLPDDPKSWGEMVTWLLSSGAMHHEQTRYLISEYPGPHIDMVLVSRRRLHRENLKEKKTSWLHTAIIKHNLPVVKMLLEAGADVNCPGLYADAPTAMRKGGRGSFRDVPERLEIVKVLEEKLSGNEGWSMPSYEEVKKRVAQTVALERRAWDEKIESMIKSRQEVPYVTKQRVDDSVPSSPLGVTSSADVYQPLSSSSSFRLLELLPSSNRTEPLVGRLVDSDITFQPNYEALSYVWGNITPVRYINLGDQDISITPNLHSALIHLRSPDTIRTLWVDALCINQSVHGERNQQVRIMGDIYKSARQVVVWLGDAADDSHLVFQHLNDESIPDSFHNDSTPPEDKRRAWSALVKRPWFFRTWVIQEIALAKRAVMMCGEESTLWRNVDVGWKPDFSSGAKGLSRSSRGNEYDHPIEGFDPDSHIWSLRLLGVGSDPISILRYSRVCQTTEIRDKIYGILGLFEPGFIPVDYDLPVENIFRQFTEAVIVLTKDLRILKHLGAKRRYPNLPSWVPDFTDTSTKSLPEEHWYAPYRKDAEEDYDVRCTDGTQISFPRASLGREYLPGLSFSRDGGLTIRGKMVDTIREVGPQLEDGIDHAPGTEGFAKVMKEWETLAAKLSPEWEAPESSVSEAFAATLTATHGSELFSVGVGFTQWYRHCGTSILESADPSMFLRDHEFYLWWLSVGKDSEEKDPDSSSEDESNQEPEVIGYDLREFSEIFTFASYGRCLFTSEKGSLGLPFSLLLPVLFDDPLNYSSLSPPLILLTFISINFRDIDRQDLDINSTGFMNLPVEIQIKIIQLAIPPMVLPEHITTTGRVVSNERVATSGITETCNIFRRLLLKARPLVGHTSAGQLFTFDPERDTLLVKGMNIPAFLTTPQIPNLHAIRRLMTFSRFPTLPVEQDYSGAVAQYHGAYLLRARLPWALNGSAFGGLMSTSPWEHIPFETSLGVAHGMQSLQEMVVVVQNAAERHIPSFQQHGP